ncbi:MAG: hypothetical protein HFH92_11355, partial [Lachnospiraceae bacterium]|nr:hypothetical protein [Lachnospiraceae bacterium]
MVKKEMIAMLLAGGQGSRLGVLTSKTVMQNAWQHILSVADTQISGRTDIMKLEYPALA